MTNVDPPPSGIETISKAIISMLPVVGGPALVIWEDVRGRVLTLMTTTIDEIADAVGNDELIARLSSSPQFEALFVNRLELVARTRYEAKRRLLSKVVINAAIDDALIDEGVLIQLALRDLDAPHIRTLARLRPGDGAGQELSGAERSAVAGP